MNEENSYVEPDADTGEQVEESEADAEQYVIAPEQAAEREASEMTMMYREEYWTERMNGIENAFAVQIIGTVIIAGCLIATLVINMFNRR